MVTDDKTSGSGTYVPASAGLLTIICEGGGGGADGGANIVRGGGGGGGGAQALLQRAVDGTESFAYTVGAGGAGSPWNTSVATAGGTSSVSLSGTTLVAAVGGSPSTSGSGAAGGQASACTGTTKTSGSAGGSQGGGGGGAGGAGASSADLTGGTGSSTNAVAGSAPGGGGKGGNNANGSSNGQGTAGGAGIVRFILTPYPVLDVGTYSDSFTVAGQWRAPESGNVLIQCEGGGGGGKGGVPLNTGGGGGGGGAYADKIIAVTKNVYYDVAPGAAGTAGIYNSGNGGDGGDSTFGVGGTVLVKAKGGKGGTNETGAAGGSAVDSIGDVKNAGYGGTTRPAGSVYNAGDGGPGAQPIGGASSPSPGQGLGANGNAPGGGGSGGGANSGGNGGAGAVGVVRIAYVYSHGAVIVAGEPKLLSRVSLIQSGVRKPLKRSVIQSGVRKSLSGLKANRNARLRPYPSWLPSGQESKFNRKTGLFNRSVGAQNLLAAVAANNARLVAVGDSLFEGFTFLNHLPPFDSTVDRLNAAPVKMRDRIIANNPGTTLGGTGFVRAVGGLNTSDPRWNLNGATGMGHVAQFTGTQKPTFTSNASGTSIAAVFLDAGGSVQIKFNGTVVATVVGTNTGAPKRVVVNGLAVTSGSTIEFATLSGDQYVAGAEVFTPNTGISMSNLGQGGATAAGSGQPSWSATSAGYSNMLPVYSNQVGCFGRAADAVFVMLGANDLGGSGTKDYTTIANGFKSVCLAFDTPTTDIIIVAEPHGSLTFASPSGYSNPLYALQYQMAVDNGWAVLDLEWLTGGYESLAGYGYTGDIYGHFNSPDGATYVGNQAADALLLP